MNYIFKLFSALTLSIGFASCGGGDLYKNEVGALDSLRVQLDSAEKKFLALDSTMVVAVLANVNTKLGRLSEIITDTIGKSEALLLSEFRSVKKPLKEFTQKFSGTKGEITITRNQLIDLAHDLSKGIMKKEDAELNFKKESSLATMLINSLTLTTDAVPIYLEKYTKLNPRIDSLVQVKEQILIPKSGK